MWKFQFKTHPAWNASPRERGGGELSGREIGGKYERIMSWNCGGSTHSLVVRTAESKAGNWESSAVHFRIVIKINNCRNRMKLR